MKPRIIQYFSSITDKGPSIAETIIRTIRNLLKKPVFLQGDSDWTSELPSVTKNYNNSIQSSIKMKPINASKKWMKKSLFESSRQKTKTKRNFILGDIFLTVDKKKYSKKEIINCIQLLKLHTLKLHQKELIIHLRGTTKSY